MSNEEWGPWIEHDGKGCPCVGEYVEVDHEGGTGLIIRKVKGWHGWNSRPEDWNVIRYRIRKPSQASTETGMAVLREILDRETIEPISKPEKVRT